jgi:glucosamine 6-phosphate synthetase-like amidotransferase/phosphosugar isomerase protein
VPNATNWWKTTPGLRNGTSWVYHSGQTLSSSSEYSSTLAGAPTTHLQVLAYHIAVRRNAGVYRPRNLAKSITVE